MLRMMRVVTRLQVGLSQSWLKRPERQRCSSAQQAAESQEPLVFSKALIFWTRRA